MCTTEKRDLSDPRHLPWGLTFKLNCVYACFYEGMNFILDIHTAKFPDPISLLNKAERLAHATHLWDLKRQTLGQLVGWG